MNALKPPTPQVNIEPDPLQIQQEQQAQVDQVSALQTKLQGDTSSIMSRYGALLTMQGGSAGTSANAASK